MTQATLDSLNFNCIVIAGMAKTGTTLPLTLLDSHPNLVVFPEELRFFHLKCDDPDGTAAADRLFNNGNIQNLSIKKEYYSAEDYIAHGGTGFGKKDYSNFNFDQFKTNVYEVFEKFENPSDRFKGIIIAFCLSMNEYISIDAPIVFVCKAPHNELYRSNWEDILGENGKYIISTRLPTEHYLSLRNVDKLAKTKMNQSVFKYINKLNRRAALWDAFPASRMYILDYDLLINNLEQTMREICIFLEIPFHDVLLKPTKMGIPWAGNSSRKIVKETVFKNKHQAFDKLQLNEIKAIEFGTTALYKKMKWPKHSKVNAFEKLKIKFQLFLQNFRPSTIKFHLKRN